MNRRIISLALAACLTSARAIDLNAPITPPPITIQSEVDRGMKSVPDDLAIRPVDYDDAVQLVVKRNKDANRDTAPFEFGLYYGAWHRLWASLSLGVLRPGTERNLMAAEANGYFSMARAMQKNIGLTDENVKDLASVSYMENENSVFAEAVKSKQFKASLRSLGDIMREDSQREHKATSR